MARSVTVPTATREQCASLDAFARTEGIELVDLQPPTPATRITASTTLTVEELRELDDLATKCGTKRGVILRGLVVGRLKATRSPQDGQG